MADSPEQGYRLEHTENTIDFNGFNAFSHFCFQANVGAATVSGYRSKIPTGFFFSFREIDLNSTGSVHPTVRVRT